MPITSSADTPQDDLGGTLSTPLGTEHIAPMARAPLPAPAVELPASPVLAAANAPAASGSGKLTVVLVSAAVLACAGIGLFAWAG